jgi:hypothetical protein
MLSGKRGKPMSHPNLKTKTTGDGAWSLIVLAGLAGLSLSTSTALRAEPMPLPLADQARVEQAIRKGVIYLKNTQGPLGTWAPEKGATHPYGFAALPALTLMECGVPASHPLIQRAFSYISQANDQLPLDKIQNTYEVALTILFLDRLSAFNDKILARVAEEEWIRSRIEILAVRLMAAQKVSGGWGYSCPPLSADKHRQLLAALSTDRAKLKIKPTSWMNKVAVLFDPVYLMGKETKAKKEAESPTQDKSSKTNTASKKPESVVDSPYGQDAAQATDNSCTQFAMLAVWVAQKHKVPIDKSMKLVVKRYRSSQNADGGWGYKYKRGGGEPTTPALTCSGLVGFALEHGVDDSVVADRAAAAKKAASQLASTVGSPSILAHFLAARAVKRADDADAAVRKRMEEEHSRKAFEALAAHVGQPAGRLQDVPQGNLYFLWALERVAMLYNLQTIGGKDWYRWGAEQLVANQKPDGNWEKGGTGLESPIVDTCFALLFLGQANLAEDLADKLKLDAQLAEKPQPQPAKNAPPPPAVASTVVTPTAPAPKVEKPLETQTNPDAGPKVTERKPSVPAVSQPDTQLATSNSSLPPSGNNSALIWGTVAGGVLLIGIVTAVLFVVLRQSGSEGIPPERRKKRPVARQRDGDSRRDGGRPKTRKGARPLKD